MRCHMKNKKTTYRVVSFLLLLIVSFVLSSCDLSEVPPATSTNAAAPPAIPLVLQGVVLDNSTGSPIGGATVLIQGTGLSATTNGNGVFTFSDLSSLSAASLVLVATAPNYTYGTASALISKTNNQASSPVILLKKIPVGTTTTITTTGGSGHTSSSEAAPNSSNNVSINVPAGALGQLTSVTITITALTVADTPPSATSTTTNDISDVDITISPEGTVFSSPGATVTFSLPYSLAPGTVLQVFKVNTAALAWETTSISATVDYTGTSATANIFTAGTYGIFDNDGITTTTGLSVIGDNERNASSRGSDASITLTNSVAYTPTLPPSSFVYSSAWSGDLLYKILNIHFASTPGTVTKDVTYNLAFPGLPEAFIVNGKETYPGTNQVGYWYYYWYYIQRQTPTTFMLNNATTAPFTILYTNTSIEYVNEDGTLGTTKKTGWYWQQTHDQGIIYGLVYYPL
jgi:hypothetical protein